MKDQFAIASDGTQIHYLDNEGSDSAIPLIIMPGMLGIAEHHQTEVAGLAPRRVIALSNRGLGKSGKVSPGMCSFEQRASDINAVVNALGLKEYVLYGFSRGVPLVVQHALQNPKAVKALVLHDCEPIYIRPSEKWRDHFSGLQKPHFSKETIEAYWADAANVDLTENLAALHLPVLLIRGALEGSLLPLEKAQALLSKLNQGQIQALENSSHEVSAEDRTNYLDLMRTFCNGLE
ncbi:alpha/beta fold hydrolase [Bdellovibrio sp. HCB337]|uniref:alpha/beta fold hydrolase n=1 Tax=Bdellovibrio sp. HCB337 TaxID=3394358 RepID=UPI0039A4082D